MRHERISIDPSVMFGKPVIQGTRITVEQVLRKLGAGRSVQQILSDHPHLAEEDVHAAAAYAADYLAREEVIYVAEPRK
ncbi:hypothetical protein BH23BAC4_BH23BAC4_14220 [soil metagenome]